MKAVILCLVLAWAVPAQDFTEVAVERMATGFRFTEGPALTPDSVLLFSDIPNNRIHQIVSGKGVSVFREDSGGANGNFVDERGRLYTCEGGARRVTRTSKDGKLEVLAERFEGKRFNAPNDIVVRKDGHVYFTDPAFGSSQDNRELPYFGVFHITPKGEVNLVAKWDKRPNGIALSPNERTLYVAGSDERIIRAYDLDRQGNATNPRIMIAGIDGVPDGIRVDSKGNIYVACNAVAIYSPEGKLLRAISMPETPANIEVYDKGEWLVFVTARTSVYRIRQEKKEPVQPK